MGNWSKIITSQFLPGKTKSQIVAQVQKIIDSLKLAHFAGLKIDLNLLRQFHLCHSPPPSGPYHALLKYWKELRAELEPYQEPLDERSVEILIPFEFHTNRLNLSIKLGIRKKLVESINQRTEDTVLSVAFDELNQSTPRTEDTIFDFRLKDTASWVPVQVALDTGASLTCGSSLLHKIGPFTPLPHVDHTIKDANGHVKQVIGYVTATMCIRLRQDSVYSHERSLFL